MENALLVLASLHQLHPLLPLCHPHSTALTTCSSIIWKVLEITLLLRWQQREELCPILGRSWPEIPSFRCSRCSPPHSQAAQPTHCPVAWREPGLHISDAQHCCCGPHAHHKLPPSSWGAPTPVCASRKAPLARTVHHHYGDTGNTPQHPRQTIL